MSVAADPQAGLGEDDMPGMYQVAGRISASGQKNYLRWTRARLVLVVIAAASGLADISVKVSGAELDMLALVAVLCFLLALGSEAYLLVSKPDQMWYHGRAIAESVKSLAWRYVMHAEPFTAAEGRDPDALFRDRLESIFSESPIAGEFEGDVGQRITPAMKKLRGDDFAVRKPAYLAGRVDDQVKWYRGKAHFNRRRAGFWRFTMLGLEFAGAILALLLLIRVLHRSVDGLVAAMIAGAGAWLEVKQFESLAAAYSLTASELSMAREDGDAITAEEAWPRYVATTEDAISREHTMWLVRRVGPRFGRP